MCVQTLVLDDIQIRLTVRRYKPLDKRLPLSVVLETSGAHRLGYLL